MKVARSGVLVVWILLLLRTVACGITGSVQWRGGGCSSVGAAFWLCGGCVDEALGRRQGKMEAAWGLPPGCMEEECGSCVGARQCSVSDM